VNKLLLTVVLGVLHEIYWTELVPIGWGWLRNSRLKGRTILCLLYASLKYICLTCRWLHNVFERPVNEEHAQPINMLVVCIGVMLSRGTTVPKGGHPRTISPVSFKLINTAEHLYIRTESSQFCSWDPQVRVYTHGMEAWLRSQMSLDKAINSRRIRWGNGLTEEGLSRSCWKVRSCGQLMWLDQAVRASEEE
jgi:hypothetical protein